MKNITSEVQNNRIVCDCNACKSACTRKPGWFKPGEAEKVSEYLGITLQELFDDYLAVDWYSEEGVDYYPLSPAAVGNPAGDMWPYNPRGACVFYEGGKCQIHAVAPFECKGYHHEDTEEKSQKTHNEIAKTWEDQEAFLIKLLKHPPFPPEPENFSEMFGLF